MKHFFSLAPVLLALTALCLSCNKPVQSEPWASVMERYAADSLVHQLLLVKYQQGSDAKAELWIKQDGNWLLDDTCAAFIGREGLGKTKEGDMKTPIGELTIGTAFGILPNPGTTIPYIEVYESVYGCDDDPRFYNTIIDTAVVHHDCHGEHLIAFDPEYNYGLATSFNSERVMGVGSCIFVHCKGAKSYTAGCVALDEPFMKHLLQVCDSNLIISIH